MKRALPTILLLAGLTASGVFPQATEAEAPAPAGPPGSRTPDAPSVIDLLAQGKTRMKHGDLESARTIFLDAATRYPDDARPHLNLAQICLDGDPPDLAGMEREARIAYGLSPSRPLGLVWLAGALRDAESLDRAEAVAQEGLSAFPDHPRLLQVLGAIRIAQGNPDAGRRLLQKAAEAAPGDLMIRRDLGLIQATENLQGQALMVLTSVRDELPADEAVRRALAGLYRYVGDVKRADEEQEMADFLAVTQARALARDRTMRSLSRRIHRLEETAAAPDAPDGTLERLWWLYEWRGDTEWNLARMEELAAARPDSPEAQAARGMVLLLRGSKEAEPLFLAALEESPAEALALEGLRRLYEGQQKMERLLELTARAVERAPQAPAAHRFRARALQATGAADAAVAAYRRALEIDAEDVESLLELADLLREQDALEEAARLVDRAAALESDTPRVEMARGLLALARGDQSAAEDHLARAEELGGRHALLFRSLGDLAKAHGEVRESLYYYRLSLGVEPDQPELVDSLVSGG